jgi:hypothetical protein
LARHLARASPVAALATLLAGEGEAAHRPYASLVTVAYDHDGTPLLLLSELAEHTANIARDARLSLLFAGGLSPGGLSPGGLSPGGRGEGVDDPLAGPRVTLLGRARRSDAPRHRARFLARHPAAAAYAGFKDFHLYAVAVERAHLVAGFGLVSWVEDADFPYGGDTEALAESEERIVAHMNADHADALALYAERLLEIPAAEDEAAWRMTGLDPEGCDLRRGAETARLDFERPIEDAAGARAELVRLTELARGKP